MFHGERVMEGEREREREKESVFKKRGGPDVPQPDISPRR